MLEKKIENIGDILSTKFKGDYIRLEAIKEILGELGLARFGFEVYRTIYGKYNDKLIEKRLHTEEIKIEDASSVENYELKMNSELSKIRVKFKMEAKKTLSDEAKTDIKKLCSILFVFIENKELHTRIKAENRHLVEGAIDGREYIVTAIEYINKYRDNDYRAIVMAINNFDGMNRLYGELIGDEIVKSYSAELVKLCDSEEIVAHRVNEKFALLIKAENVDKVLGVMNNCKIKQMIDGKETTISLTAAGGMSKVNVDNASVETIILEPRWAIAYAQNEGIKLAEVTDELRDKILLQRRIEDTFEEALAKEYIQLWFQPKVDIRDNSIIGVEALARWIEPDVSFMPSDFVPVLEEAGLIKELDFYVLEKACNYISIWQGLGNSVVPLSLNFSRRNLDDSMLPARINSIIEKYKVNKNNIIIEITETATEQMQNQLHYFLNQMREYGIETSVDDFGTGYASLAMLRDFSLNEIKVDRSFVNVPIFDRKNRIILMSILKLAKSLGMKVIVEGVETIEQRDFLKELGVNFVQGYLYDKPLPRFEFEDRLLSGYSI